MQPNSHLQETSCPRTPEELLAKAKSPSTPPLALAVPKGPSGSGEIVQLTEVPKGYKAPAGYFLHSKIPPEKLQLHLLECVDPRFRISPPPPPPPALALTNSLEQQVPLKEVPKGYKAPAGYFLYSKIPPEKLLPHLLEPVDPRSHFSPPPKPQPALMNSAEKQAGSPQTGRDLLKPKCPGRPKPPAVPKSWVDPAPAPTAPQSADPARHKRHREPSPEIVSSDEEKEIAKQPEEGEVTEDDDGSEEAAECPLIPAKPSDIEMATLKCWQVLRASMAVYKRNPRIKRPWAVPACILDERLHNRDPRLFQSCWANYFRTPPLSHSQTQTALSQMLLWDYDVMSEEIGGMTSLYIPEGVSGPRLRPDTARPRTAPATP